MLHARLDYTERIVDTHQEIPENEPVFLIRGQDAVGAEAVLAWARMNERAGGDPALSAAAKVHAQKMAAWPFHKLADAPADVLPPIEASPYDLGGIGLHPHALSDTSSPPDDVGEAEEPHDLPTDEGTGV